MAGLVVFQVLEVGYNIIVRLQALSAIGVLLLEALLPELARFFGIIVRMYAEPGEPHHCPRFHVYSQHSRGIQHRTCGKGWRGVASASTPFGRSIG